MIYLIGQLSIWLMLTATFAAIAGWAFAAHRASAAERTLRRDRENLIRDLVRLAGEDSAPEIDSESERETDSLRRMLELRDGRITELEQAAETARARADDAAGEVAELQRRLSQSDTDSEELTRLRAFAEEVETQRALVVDVDHEPVAEPAPAPLIDDETLALQTWRLRYFEQRVQYLENLSKAAAAEAPEPDDVLPLEWRAREAEARAAYLEQELRRAPAIPDAPEPEAAEELAPFASSADVDALLRWRLLYLERRVAYLQAQAAEQPTPEPQSIIAPQPAETADPDRWKWRARYLEARVRHLEQRAVEAPAAAQAIAELEPDAAPAEPESPRPAARARGAKPSVLGSPRNGAPDDLTLIEGVSLMQQSTLYSVGVFHFDQIAAWTPENVAWVDQYLRLGGRIDEEEWLEQADTLAREGPAARRAYESEDA